MDEAQAGINIAGRNINNLRYADDATLMTENEEELKSLLMKVKGESEKVGLNKETDTTERLSLSLSKLSSRTLEHQFLRNGFL